MGEKGLPTSTPGGGDQCSKENPQKEVRLQEKTVVAYHTGKKVTQTGKKGGGDLSHREVLCGGDEGEEKPTGRFDPKKRKTIQ